MLSLKNRIIIASAGSRKTTHLVELALEKSDQNILLLAYTNNNLDQIHSYIIESKKILPKNITIQSWHSFILAECVKPYQKYVYDKDRIESIYYPEDLGKFKSARRFIKKSNIEKYFIIGSKFLISEHLSEFARLCNEKSQGMVIDRLQSLYNYIFIDEFQDLAGYDFNLVELLLRSKIGIHIVGDSRQATYFTNNSNKNINFKGENIIDLFHHWEGKSLCKIEERNQCYRSNQHICDFSDYLYPALSKTESKNLEETGHDGVFIISSSEIPKYFSKYSPVVLRYSRSTDVNGYFAYNFGESKGKTFRRVLIYPNKPIKNYLKNGDPSKLEPVTKSKFYVGITRAKYSVALVYDDICCESISRLVKRQDI